MLCKQMFTLNGTLQMVLSDAFWPFQLVKKSVQRSYDFGSKPRPYPSQRLCLHCTPPTKLAKRLTGRSILACLFECVTQACN